MFRITINETPTEQLWILQGRLSGLWVSERRKCWNKAHRTDWLTRIVINEALILLRKCRGRREALINDSTEGTEGLFALEIPDSGPNPEDSYSQRERQRILFAALNKLPHGTRRANQLRELGERSTEETARIMRISVGALKGRMFHGRRRLRERLQHIVKPAWRSATKTSQRVCSTTHISKGQVPCNACA